MDYGVGQKLVFCGLLSLGSTHHLPIEPNTLSSVYVKWLPKYLIIFILSDLFIGTLCMQLPTVDLTKM